MAVGGASGWEQCSEWLWAGPLGGIGMVSGWIMVSVWGEL